MNSTNNNTTQTANVTKALLTLSSSLLIVASSLLLPISTASAETQFKLKSVSDQAIVTEGYKRSVEEWIEGVERHRNISGTKHNDHRDPEVWIASVGTLLFDDTDEDGYFSGFSLSIDADVEWGHTDVYLNIYLQEQGYENRLFHTSSAYTIYDNSESDEYGIEVELLDNYPANLYDIQIDLHDAHSYEILDSVSSVEMQNLGGLPLESEATQPPPPQPSENIVTHVGSAGPFMLILCAVMLSISGFRNLRNSTEVSQA